MHDAAEIGGYLGLELPDRGEPFAGRIRLQSASAALRALIEATGLRSVALPHYTCDAVIDAIGAAGARPHFYALNEDLLPASPERLAAHDAALCIDYFGLCGARVARLISDHPQVRWIVDASQALFAEPHPGALATVYSPRKFLGLPDGGLLACASGVDVPRPTCEDTGSFARMEHLLRRLAGETEAGHGAYREAEQSLRDATPLAMSPLTRRLMSSIDLERVRSRRRANYARLALHLAPHHAAHRDLDASAVPLCYPLRLNEDASRLRAALREQRVYVPTFWPEVPDRVPQGSLEHALATRVLPLPIDQRYDERDMDRLAALVLDRLAPGQPSSTGIPRGPG